MNIFEAIDKRHSTREFLDKKIPVKIIEKIIAYAYKIPSAGNLKPLELFYVQFKGYPTYIIISANFDKTTVKYGDRGKRYVYMEAGHTAQNICLVCEELGLGSCCIGAFNDAEIKQKYHIEFEPIYIIAVGYPK